MNTMFIWEFDAFLQKPLNSCCVNSLTCCSSSHPSAYHSDSSRSHMSPFEGKVFNFVLIHAHDASYSIVLNISKEGGELYSHQ